VAEVMEFDNNFYALVVEAGAGRAALELLIDPYTGAVGPEPGPNMMWNDKYGHMSFGAGGENSLSMDEARAFAQQSLDAQLPGSKVHEDGASFWLLHLRLRQRRWNDRRHVLSRRRLDRAVWLHTWHGGFISEWKSRRCRLDPGHVLARPECDRACSHPDRYCSALGRFAALSR
jgi:hypothetical protein